MNRVIERLNCLQQNILLIPTVKQYLNELSKYEQLHILSALLKDPAKSDQVLDKLAEKDKYLAEEIRARLRTTMTPTIVQGGLKENIIPSECEAVFDCRVLPGQSPEKTLAQIKKDLKKAGLDKLAFETIQASQPSESPLDTPLRDQIVTTMKEFKPESRMIPTLLTGGTDSRFFRNRGSVCYGFHPIEPETSYSGMQKTIHGIDERISTRNLVFGTSVLYDIIEKFMTKNRTKITSKS
jgi:acetylornithine deacetylase/succinyl-diaminopimelate desuccinylase-like protein